MVPHERGNVSRYLWGFAPCISAKLSIALNVWYGSTERESFPVFRVHTAKTQYRKFETIFPKKEFRGISPNFHIYVYVSDFFSHDQSAYSAAGKYVDRSWEYINRS